MTRTAERRLLRRGRWAVSFADLCLLLMGFFVLMLANGGRQREVVNEIAREFGAPQSASDRLIAAQLFEPGEAMLSAAGAARLAKIARSHAGGTSGIEIHSIGQDRTRSAYDAWDLSAARLGAVARALSAGGIGRERLTIRGLDQGQKGSGSQIITVVYDTQN